MLSCMRHGCCVLLVLCFPAAAHKFVDTAEVV